MYSCFLSLGGGRQQGTAEAQTGHAGMVRLDSAPEQQLAAPKAQLTGFQEALLVGDAPGSVADVLNIDRRGHAPASSTAARIDLVDEIASRRHSDPKKVGNLPRL